jgi:hypothetical protein
MIEEVICNMNGDMNFIMSETNKLAGTNYKVWKAEMKMILMKERLWELVTSLLTIIVINAYKGVYFSYNRNI